MALGEHPTLGGAVGEDARQVHEFRTQIGALQDVVLRHERDLLRLIELSVAVQKLVMVIEERLKPLERREKQLYQRNQGLNANYQPE